MPTPDCPTRAELDLFQAGDLDEAALASVSSHIEGCPTCQRSLETIIGDSTDTVLSALLAEPMANPFAEEVACRNAMERVAAMADQAGSGVKQLEPTISLRAAPIPADDEGLPLETIREYKLLAKLGEGGMGAVYKALHTRLDKVVALKVLPEGRMRDGGSVARFQREMKAVGRLDHPNIVRAMDAGEEEGTHFLVMEYVEGIDLSQLAKNVGQLPVVDACELIRQAAIGLQEAHEHGMVHRDIKPSNLILAKPARKKSPPTLKILDLGLALLAEGLAPDQELTSTGQMMGTIDYMAPEQGSDTHNVDIRADIYSLGATLYRLLTGSAPFAGVKFDTPVKKILALATKEPAAVQTLRADVPPALAAIVHKMLAKDPAQRFATPEELAEALAPFCQGPNLAALLERGIRAAQSKVSGEAHTHPQLSSPSVATAPTIDYSIKKDTKKPRQTPQLTFAGLGRRIPRSLAIAAACGGIALTVLLGVVLYLETLKGTIRIEINDPDIKVVLDEKGATFQGVDKKHSVRVQSGQHGLTITRGDLTFHTDEFVLTKGETIRLSVNYLPGKLQVVRNNEKQAFGEWPLANDSPIAKPAVAKLPKDFALQFEPENRVIIDSLTLDRSGPLTFELSVVVGQSSFSDFADLLGKRYQIDMYLLPKNNHWTFSARFVKGFRSVDGGAITKDRRTHVAGVRTADQMKVFVDGKLIASCPILEQPLIEQKTPFFIGGRLFAGQIDEVRISKSARYDQDFTPKTRFEPDAETLALYHFDEGQGDVLTDCSGHNHHGKIVRAKWVKAEGSPASFASGWQGWPKYAPAPAIAPFDATQARTHQEQWAEYLGVPVEHENSLGMTFVLIPPGEFMMGSTQEEIQEALKIPDENEHRPKGIRSEGPRHKVVLTQAIYLGVHEVTQSAYELVMGTNPSKFSPGGEKKNAMKGIDSSMHPVEGVSWNDAVEFCAKLSQREKLEPCYERKGETVTFLAGTGYRLPTEAQWEFACRAGTVKKYWTGDDDEAVAGVGWLGSSGGRTHPVGELQANPFGLHDIHGNVWEWVQDRWSADYYALWTKQPAIDPAGSGSENPTTTGSMRSVRGGSWGGPPSHARSSSRETPFQDTRVGSVGFRVVLPVDAVKAATAARKSEPVGRDREAAQKATPK